jgi:response regulator of citrate/malate metabolism
VLSAAREPEMVAAALQGGVVSYLLKPFKITELQARLAGYAERCRVLARPGEVSQNDLDLLLGATPTGAIQTATALPKGLSKETGLLVEQALRGAVPDLAASECGEALGLSRVVARKYLERLVDIGDAVVTLRYGQTGRPQRRYAWVHPGR